MFDIPYIPAIVFIFILIPPIIMGIVRGWRASLLFAVSMLVIIGIEVAFSEIFYDKIWDMLKKVYIGKVQPGLSVESLKNIAKPSVIVLFIGICIPFSYIAYYSLYFPLRNKLKKHLYPKTKEISKGKKKIERSPKIFSRTMGALISSIASLGLASIAATSATALFTHPENRNSFHRNVSTISKIYTFGKGELNEELIATSQIAEKYLTAEVQGYLRDILFLGQDQQDTLKMVPSLSDIKITEFYSRLQGVKDNPEVMETIANMIVNSDIMRSAGQVTLIDKDFTEINLDGKPGFNAHNKPSSIQTTSYNNMDAHLASIEAKKLGLALDLTEDIIDIFVDFVVKNQIASFESSGFYLEWKNDSEMVAELEKHKKEISDREAGLVSDFNTKVKSIQELYSQRDEDKRKLEEIGMDSEVPSNNNYHTFESHNTNSVNASIKNQNGLLKTLITKIADLKIAKDTAHNNKVVSDTSYAGAENNQDGDGGISEIYNNKKRRLDDAKGKLDTINHEISELNNRLTAQKALLEQYKHDSSDNQSLYENIHQSQIDAFNNPIATKINIINGLNTQIHTIQQEKAVKEREINDIFNHITYLGNQLRNNQDALDNHTPPGKDTSALEAEIARDQADLVSSIADKIVLEAELEDIAKNLSDTIVSKQRVQNELHNLSEQKQNLVIEKEGYRLKWEEAKTNIQTANAAIHSTGSDISNKEKDKVAITSEFKYASRDFDAYVISSNYEAEKQQFITNNQIYEKATLDLSNKENELVQKREERENIKSHLDSLLIKRNEIIIEQADLSRAINVIESKIPPTQFTEVSVPWKFDSTNVNYGNIDKHINYDATTVKQSYAYNQWWFESIKGTEDYIKYKNKILASANQVKIDKQREYDILKQKYIDTLKGILRR